jgi:hypothetical protein
MKAGVLFAVMFFVALPAGAQQLPTVAVSTAPPPAAVSVPNPLTGGTRGPVDLYQSPDGSDRFQRGSQYPAQPIFLPPGYIPGSFCYGPGPYCYWPQYDPYLYQYDPYLWMPTTAQQLYHYYRQRALVLRGGLVLETLPDDAQVFVDGYFVGAVEEFGLHGRPMDIPAGPHRIELRAPGYETLSFSVLIEPNQILRYRGDLQSVSPPRPIVMMLPQPGAHKTLYVIPNCYAGDRPPTGALPAGCDLKKLQTRK